MKVFTKKAIMVPVIGVMLGGAFDPAVSAQVRNEDCYKGAWVDTMGPAIDRVMGTIDPRTSAPYFTVEGVTNYVKASLDLHPALWSYASGSTVRCTSSS